MAKQFHVFISHASEDNSVAFALEAALKRESLEVWLDRDELKLGQSITGRIDEGLRQSEFVVVILSRDFLRKDWPRRELEAVIDRVLPVRYGMTQEQVRAEAPLVGALKSTSWDEGDAKVIAAILERVRAGAPTPRSDVAVDLAHKQTDWDDFADAVEAVYPKASKLARGLYEEEAVLKATRVFILALPRQYRFSRPEIDMIQEWVAAGGGLLLMGHYGERHHETNVTEVAWRFNLEFGDDVVMPAARATDRAHARSVDPDYMVAATPSVPDHPLAAGVREARFISAASVRSVVRTAPEFTLEASPDCVVARHLGHIDPSGGRPNFDDQVEDRRGPVSLLAARRWRKGRVVAAGTWKLWTVDHADNARLIRNVVDWLRGE